MVEEAVSNQPTVGRPTVGAQATEPRSAIRLKTPLKKEDVLKLKLGDMALISGRVVTGRDRVHKFLFNEKPGKADIPFELEGSILYHCGPIIKRTEQGYSMISGGPTTSLRVDMYEPHVIKTYGIRAIIGKAGMSQRTLAAFKESGCVYLAAISGAAVYLADRVKKIIDGWKIEEFGPPEAMWLLEVEDFPAIVTMDSHGNSLHKEIEDSSYENFKRLLQL